jgi:hypothetical protein
MSERPRIPRARLASRGADVVLVTVREMRLLLGLLLILFVTSETWRYIGRLTVPRFVLLVVITLTVALLVVGLGLRHTIGASSVKRAVARVASEVLAFGAALFLVFVVIGVLSVDADLVGEWTGEPTAVLVSLGLGRPPMVLTAPLLQVGGFLSCFGALAFAVEVVTDASTRQLLVGDLIGPGELTV